MIGKLSSEGQTEISRQADQHTVTAGILGDWMEVERNDNVREGIVEDTMEIKEEESCGLQTLQRRMKMMEIRYAATIPMVSALAALFFDIE